jgi:hypothetical protein
MSQPSTSRGAAVRVTAAGLLAAALAASAAEPARAGPATTGDAARSVTTSADTTAPRLERVWFSRASVRVSGLNLVPVTVSVHITDASGITEFPRGEPASPRVVLSPLPGFRSRVRPLMIRTSGTVTDGVWSATLQVPSTWNGTVRVTEVGAEDIAGNVLTRELTGRQAATLRVIGTHRPALTLRYTVLPTGGFRLHGRAYFTDTRQPIARLPLVTGYGSLCNLENGATTDIVTDARGHYQKRFTDTGLGCVALIGSAALHQYAAVLVYRSASRPPVIRDEALLQPEDLNGATPTPLTDDGNLETVLPPRPCAGGPFPSTALRRSYRSVMAFYGVDERPHVSQEHVAVYHSDGAHRYLGELRTALRACDGPDQSGASWTVLATGVAGDESLLLRRRTYIDYVGAYQSTYLMVARIGRVLVVVHDVGWEDGSGQEQIARDLGVIAVRRAAVLNENPQS